LDVGKDRSSFFLDLKEEKEKGGYFKNTVEKEEETEKGD